ncbi:MAG: SRPBCC family protein [Chloroflexi bacterium]|nr:SRPBCC family protein [Chloroflexota bacterium]
MGHVINTVLINRPIEEVFNLATTPKNWPRYHPNSLGVSGVTERPVRVGDVTRERANLGGRIGEGDWKVVEHEPLRRVVWTIDNPGFEGRLIYAFEAQAATTRFTRDLEYQTPFDSQPETAAQFEQYMHGESEKAVQNLKRVMESKG